MRERDHTHTHTHILFYRVRLLPLCTSPHHLLSFSSHCLPFTYTLKPFMDSFMCSLTPGAATVVDADSSPAA